jgi:glutathione synthase/RimK-type ligase-like ATP-grasp enzyme
MIDILGNNLLKNTLMKRIAIHQNKKKFNHSGSWDNPWINYCDAHQIEYEIIDCYQSDIISRLKEFDCLLWHFSNYSHSDMLFARSILNCAKRLGLKIFPDFNEAWHFDDKIAETYILQTINAPIPQSQMFYLYEDVEKWLDQEIVFPIVAKLRTGSGSHNVKLLKSKKRVLQYAKKMFGNGYSPYPSVFYKAKSNYNSSKGNKNVMMSRIKRIPEFYRTLRNAKKFPNEKGYVFFQEFIPNNGYDLKIVVIGDKLSFIARHIRKNDFRASGGGDIYYDRSLITRDIIDSAFFVNDKLGLQCMGYDYVVNLKTGVGKIVEMSYGFSHIALLQANGYFDREAIWHDEPLNAPEDILRNILKIKENE